MKTKLFIVSIAMASTLSQVSTARDPRDFTDREPFLTAVKWMGTLRCEDQETASEHRKDHKCDLEFVNDTTNEVWSVKENPTLTTIHLNEKKDLKVHIEAMRSPRYLLGGNFVEIKKIETLPSDLANRDEQRSKQTHICSLETTRNEN